MECTRCGAPGEFVKLHDVISGEGIVKVCDKCLSGDSSPVIHRPTEAQIQGVLKSESLYKRLSSAAGLDPIEHKQNIQDFQKKDVIKKQEVTLRDLVDQKYDQIGKKARPKKKRHDLVDNFHWLIMRARRSKKLTISQLAERVKEPERVIKMAEQGILPEGDYNVVQKLEEVLGVRIMTQEVADELERRKTQLGFDEHSTKNLTISDLHEMRGGVPGMQKEPYWRRLVSRLAGKKEDVSKEEIDKVINQDEYGLERVEPEPEDSLEFEGSEKEVEFDDTSLEISENLEEEESEEKQDKDLSQEEIDDLIFGRK